MDSTDSAVAPPSASGGARRRRSDLDGWTLAGTAVLLQVVLLWDFAMLVLTDLVVSGRIELGGYPEDPAVMAVNRVLVVGVWALAVGVVYVWSRRTGLFQRMFTWRDEGTLVVASVAAIALHVLDNLVMAAVAGESLGPQGLGEHAHFVGMYGSVEGTLVFGLQSLYYVFETLVVVFMIGLFQQAGESWFGRRRVPWGGIGLALTWGALHFLMTPSLELIVVPLAMGIVYLAGKKHVVPVFLAVILVFFV